MVTKYMLVNDYKIYGSLDLICCFVFESFLGKLKNFVQSGYKLLQQVAFFAWHENNKIMYKIFNDCKEFGGNRVYSLLNDPVVSFPSRILSFKFQSGSVINTASARDSTILFDGNIGIATDLVENEFCKYIVCKKFLIVKDFFRKPICSSKVGIYLVDKISESFEVIECD